jgi:hypothetical protein
MIVKTVAELIEFLKQFPPDTQLSGYNGSDGEPPISVYFREKEKPENFTDECDRKAAAESTEAVVVSVDW